MSQAVLTLNSGSSSIKFALYSAENTSHKISLLCQGEFEGIPTTLHFSAHDAHGNLEDKMIEEKPNFQTALSYLLKWVNLTFPQLTLSAFGHRIVHGGERYTESVVISEDVLTYLETLSPLAPLHQPHNLAGIRTLQALHPTLPQIACFDTSFHHTDPRLATLFALPSPFWKEGIRRFGFHGLSYQYISETLPQYVGDKAKGRVIVAHLGHGASMCAIKGLKSLATTMGLTALDGLPMGTRCGNIDPGVLLYLSSEKGYSTQELSDLLYKKSGLLGLSGVSGDMKELLQSKSPQATEAINYFCYQVRRQLASLMAALEGLDIIVFTGGIGENAWQVRQKVCDGLKWLNVELDEELNASFRPTAAARISSLESGIAVWVIPTNEEIVIAQDVFKLIKGGRNNGTF
ncbi:MAG: acetate/propionate family kinase [Alphaproteobacteria bacterium]|nr:acetate/propionate family kinase [Alphaproteobacteria bacterium]